VHLLWGIGEGEKSMWNKIVDWFKSLFGGGYHSFDKFADPSKPFMGYGLVNNWSAQNADSYMEKLVKNNVQCMAFEFFEWATPDKFAAVDNLLKKFEKYVIGAKKRKLLLYVTILNSNIGSGKYGDPGIPSNKYTTQIMKVADKLASWMKSNKNIFVTPCGEGGAQSKMASHDKKFQEYCKSIMPRSQMVNNWGSRPDSTDGMAYLCQHPAKTTSPCKSWVMSDHGLLIAELNGGGLYGNCSYAITMPYAKKLKKANKAFIYYHFNKNGSIDMEALRSLDDAQK